MEFGNLSRISKKRRRVVSVLVMFALLFGICTPFIPAVNALSPSYTASSSYQTSSYYTKLCNVTLTGNQREDIVNVALSQVGYREGSSSNDYSGADDGSYNNYTEYNYWYHNYVSSGMPVGGSSAPWCATFVSWCAEMAQVPSSVLKRSTAAGHGANYFDINFYSGSSTLASSGDNDSYFKGYNYTPQKGDLFYTRSWSHVGLVVAVDGSYVTTVEGNTNNNGSSEGNGVYQRTRKISDLYFGVPNYVEKDITTPGKPTITGMQKTYTSGSNITFTWTATENTTHYNLTLHKLFGTEYVWWDAINYAVSGHTLTLEEGAYRVLVTSTNSNAWTDDGVTWKFTESEWVYFTVSPATQTVTFDANGGSCSVDSQVVLTGGEIGVLPVPEREGYIFVGWYPDKRGNYDPIHSSTIVATDMTLYAHWMNPVYMGNKVVFDTNGGQIIGEVNSHILSGFNISRKQGYLVVYNCGSQSVATNAWGVEFVVAPNGEVIEKRNYEDENQLTVPEGGFILSGHISATAPTVGEFLNTIDVGSYVGYDEATGMVYSYSTRDAYLFNHTYVAEGETYGTLPVSINEDMIFKGWYTSPEGGSRITEESVFVDQELYAIWEKKFVIPTLNLEYPSLSFEGEIMYNLYFTADDVTSVVEMGLIAFSTKNTEGTIDNAENVYPGYIEAGGMYMSQTAGVPARYLGDAVYFKAYAKLSDGSYVYSGMVGYNAVVYAKAILQNSTNDYMKRLVVAMINYGAEAQGYFCGKEGVEYTPMNNFLTADQQALINAYDASMVADLISVDSSKIGMFTYNTGDFTKRSNSVSFDGAFAINYYFTAKGTPDNGMKFYYWNTADYLAADVLTPENATGTMDMVAGSGNQYWSQVSGIAAKEVDHTYFVAGVYELDGVTYTTGILAYSLGKYCAKLAAGTTEQQALSAATAVYGYYAKEYFTNI